MRKPGGVAIVKGNRLRELRDEVRFGETPYADLAPKYGYKTGMSVLKAARRYERDKGLGPTDPSPAPDPEPEAALP